MLEVNAGAKVPLRTTPDYFNAEGLQYGSFGAAGLYDKFLRIDGGGREVDYSILNGHSDGTDV